MVHFKLSSAINRKGLPKIASTYKRVIEGTAGGPSD